MGGPGPPSHEPMLMPVLLLPRGFQARQVTSMWAGRWGCPSARYDLKLSARGTSVKSFVAVLGVYDMGLLVYTIWVGAAAVPKIYTKLGGLSRPAFSRIGKISKIVMF